MDAQTSRRLLGVPKYLQVREAMVEMIREETLPPGHLLPSEGELCERFGGQQGDDPPSV